MVFVVDAGTFEGRFLVFVFLISFNLLNRVSEEYQTKGFSFQLYVLCITYHII
ncbi:hypothetical protein ACE6H2_022962 [Prunus campanulata]